MRLLPGSVSKKRWALAIAGVSVLGAAAYGSLIEPNWIETVRTIEFLPMVRPPAPDLTLVQVSDIHIGALGRRERRAIEIINQARPDIIVVSGDLVHGGDRPRELEAFLVSLRARYGKFLVWGNHDYGCRVPLTWGPAVVKRAGFTLLRNSSSAVTYPGGRIVIAGLDDAITGHDNLRLAMTRVSRKDACILVSHPPEIVSDLGNWDIDLVLTGHTHGGQVRVPLLGALWVPLGTRDHLEGWFDVPPDVRLHVSRGLGWSWLPIRFFCRPAIDIITLRAGRKPGKSARSDLGQS